MVIRVDRINLAAGNTTDSDATLDQWLPRLKKWGYLIQEIKINQLNYGNHTMSITYRDGHFFFLGNEFVLEAQADHVAGIFFFTLNRLEIKPYQLILSGNASYTRKEDRFHFSGFFESSWGNGKLLLEEKKGQVDAQISTDGFTDLAAFLKQFPLDQDAITWIAENISAKSCRIDQLHLQFSLDNLRDFGPENISGSATAEAGTVQFHPGLAPVQWDTIKITFQDDRLFFALQNPTYQGISLEGSSVYIDNVIEPDSVLVISIKTKTRLDETALALLAAHDVNLPFRQLTGQTDASVSLLFDLPEFILSTKGTFIPDLGEWIWGDTPLQVQGATIQLADEKVTIQEAEIAYRDILRTRLSGQIDTSAGYADLISEIMELNYTAKNAPLLQAEQTKLPLKIDFSHEPTLVDLESINTSIILNEKETIINIDSLATASPFIPPLQGIPLAEGNIRLVLKNASDFEFTGEVELPNSLLFFQDKPAALFRFQGSGTPDETNVSINNGSILVDVTDRVTVTLNDHLLVLDMNTLDMDHEMMTPPLPVEITGPRTLIRVKDHQIDTREFELRIIDSGISYDTELEKGRFQFKSSGGKQKFIGTDLDATIAEKFISFADLTGGTINIDLNGDDLGYNGYLEFNNVIIRDYVLMYNLLAFLNSIPALATLSEPGFDSEGYRVKEGIVLFDLQDNLLTIRQVRTDGETVNTEASGWIDLDNRTLKMNMELVTLTGYSKIIGMVPWAGYAILGEDGSLSTSLKIDGSLDDPTINTYLARDIIMTPVNIIKRSIEWPFKIFSSQGTDTPKPSELEFPAPMAPE